MRWLEVWLIMPSQSDRKVAKINARLLTRDGEYAHLAILPDFVLCQKERQKH